MDLLCQTPVLTVDVPGLQEILFQGKQNHSIESPFSNRLKELPDYPVKNQTNSMMKFKKIRSRMLI